MSYRRPNLEKGWQEWSGYVTIENAADVAALLRRELVGKTFSWAEFNDGLPTLRLDTGRTLSQNTSDESGISCDVGNDKHGAHAHIIVCDSYGVWGLSTDLATQPSYPPEKRSTEEERAIKWAPRVSWSRSASLSTWAFHVELRVAAGYTTRWTVAVEGQG